MPMLGFAVINYNIDHNELGQESNVAVFVYFASLKKYITANP